jgi:LysR family hydrogen peroxide-inducible transcriptional activator
MTLQQLKYIVAIDEYRHFGKAAEACGLTQSTLSLMVKKMEDELDVRIFDRDAHPVAPTAIGRRIIDQAKVVLYNVGQIVEMTSQEKELLSGRVKIALISTVSPVLVPGLFKYFGQKYPSISLQTEEMLTETIKDKLRKAEVDIGIVAGEVNDPAFLEIPLYHERFLAYVSQDSPLYSKEKINMDDLYGQPLWIIRDGLRKQVLKEMESGGEVTYERYFEGGRVGMLIQIVNENGGVTIIPETHKDLILYSQQSGLRPIINPERTRTISLLIRNDYLHESLLNAVVDAVKNIIPGNLLESVILRSKYLKI